MKQLLFLGSLTSCAFALPQYFNTIGRGDIDNQQFRVSWPGSGMEVRFTGHSLALELGQTSSHWDVDIDGTTYPTLYSGSYKNTIIIDDKLASGEHTLRLRLRSEFSTGYIKNIIISDTAHFLPVTPKYLEIFHFGDSFSAGYGNESKTKTCTNGAIDSTTNAVKTYPSLVADFFKANVHLNAISGKGMVRNYNGADAGNPLPIYAFKTNPYLDGVWPSTQSSPNLITIALGGNDFSTPLRIGEEEWLSSDMLKNAWQTQAHKLLDSLRKQYGGVPFVFISYPNFSGSIATIKKTVEEEISFGYKNVFYFASPSLTTNGCQWHPDLADNKKIADSLISFINKNNIFNLSKDDYKGEVPSSINMTHTFHWNGKDQFVLPSGFWDIRISKINGEVLYSSRNNQNKILIPNIYGLQIIQIFNSKENYSFQINRTH